MPPGMLQQAANAANPAVDPAADPAAQAAPVQDPAAMAAPPEGVALAGPAQEVPGPAADMPGSAAPGDEPKTKMEPATAQEQQEYERAMAALHEVLYGNDDTSNTIIKSLQDTPKSKIDPLVKTSLLLIQQIDDKIDLDEAVIAQFTGEVVERLIELSEVRYKTNYSDKEAQTALGATWEGVIQLFDGADQGEFDNLTRNLHPDDIAKSEKMYGELLHG